MNGRDELRSTYVDLRTERSTRNPEVRDAWKEHGADLVACSEPYEIERADVDRALESNEIWVYSISPEYLARPDRALSFMDLVFRSTEYSLYRRQRQHAVAHHRNGAQRTLKGWSA